MRAPFYQPAADVSILFALAWRRGNHLIYLVLGIPGMLRKGLLMTELFDRIKESAAYIRGIADIKPSFGIILGSGLGGLAKKIKVKATIPYEDIPNFPVSTVKGLHAGNLILGELCGTQVVAMEGRVHYYEGYTLEQVTFPIRAMKALGARSLILTSAVGGIHQELEPGDIVIVTDHINLMGDNPLIGPNDERLGPRFPDMSEPYNRAYIAHLERAALEVKITTKRAVLAALAGPCLETAAEYRFLRRIGADVVGMSMVPETIVAVHASMKVLGLSVVTDKATPDCLEPVNIAQIVANAKKGEAKLEKLVCQFLSRV
jgi:purine-nucleoside phosphorylase